MLGGDPRLHPAVAVARGRDRTVGMIESIRMGDVRDLSNFMGAVIDRKAFERISGYIDLARESATIVAGGKADASTGYFCPRP